MNKLPAALTEVCYQRFSDGTPVCFRTEMRVARENACSFTCNLHTNLHLPKQLTQLASLKRRVTPTTVWTRWVLLWYALACRMNLHFGQRRCFMLESTSWGWSSKLKSIDTSMACTYSNALTMEVQALQSNKHISEVLPGPRVVQWVPLEWF